MKNTFIHLQTKATSYVLFINAHLHLENLYYGARLGAKEDLSILQNKQQNFMGTATMYDGEVNSPYSLDYINLEVGSLGKGDYRKPSLLLKHDLGYVSDFKVTKHGYFDVNTIETNELPLPHGADAYYAVYLQDEVSKCEIRLDYLIFNNANVLARRLVVEKGNAVIEKAASLNLDLDNKHFNVYYSFGTWANEWRPASNVLTPGTFEIATNAGPSSNRHNPFLLLRSFDASLDRGSVYGFNLVYSGPFKATLETTFTNKVRIQHGINDETFSYDLNNGPFFTPFAVMTYSQSGENGVSQNFHAFVENNIVRPAFKRRARPILLNNWEATYFDFNEKKLKALIKAAEGLGIELFVLDDGWFKNRKDDFKGLGHYELDQKKLPHGLQGISAYAQKKGLQFGLWFEPEMVSPDHEIVLKHPAWIVQIPGISPSKGRFQYALDLTNKEVQDYIISNVSRILKDNAISYVKWDYNRNLSDFYTKNGSVNTFFYDYTRGLYRILKTLTDAFPSVLWEGCASGGNRFDLGVLSYFDQIWVSDCSDAHERIRMHTTLAKAYPFSVLSAHVSAVPNHQMLRSIPLQTRFNNAFLSAGFGYELDVTRLTPQEIKEIKLYNETAKAWQHIIFNSHYYELVGSNSGDEKAFALLNADHSAAVVLVATGVATTLPTISKLPPLPMRSEGIYTVTTLAQATDIKVFGSLVNRVLPKFMKSDGKIIDFISKRRSAEALMKLEVQETYVVSGQALEAGALTLYPKWSATGISDSTRISRDFTSVLYFISRNE